MSLHTIEPESLPVEVLWQNLRKHYPEIQRIRLLQVGLALNQLKIYSQILEEPDGRLYTVEILDTYDYESFISASSKTVREALIKMDAHIENWIFNHDPEDDE